LCTAFLRAGFRALFLVVLLVALLAFSTPNTCFVTAIFSPFLATLHIPSRPQKRSICGNPASELSQNCIVRMLSDDF
jgi:hypothetical protein